MKFCNELETHFRKESNRELAVPMENYMKNNFPFLGIKTEKRRAIFKSIYEQNKAEIKSNFRTIAWELFQMKEREFHQVAIDLLVKESMKNFAIEDIKLIEKLIITNSWWDSVDTIAKYLLGGYLQQFPLETLKVIVRQPLTVTNTTAKYDVIANVKGGGFTGQAGAIRHGIARALNEANSEYRPALKSNGFLTRDPRMKERKKYGLKKARKAPQFSKR